MKKIFYFLLVMFTGFSMQFDSFNGKVYFDRKAENEIVRTDNINLGIDISSKEYDVVVFEFINFSDIKQEDININEKNSLKLKLKNYDILFLKEDIQKYLDEKNISIYNPQTIRDAVMAIRADKLPDPKIKPNTPETTLQTIISSCTSFFSKSVLPHNSGQT